MKHTWQTACNILLVLGLVFIFFYWKQVDFGSTLYAHDSVSYPKGVVQDVLEEKVEEKYPGLMVGSQKLVVKISDAMHDKPLVVDNYLTTEHSIYVHEGSRVVVYADEPQGMDPFYSLYNYDRSLPMAAYCVLFLGLLYGVGRVKGLKSVLALCISLYLIFFFMLPMMYTGKPPVVVSIATVVLGSIYSIVILQGYTRMGLVNLISVAIGFLIAAIGFYAVAYTANLNGFKLNDVEGLLLITARTGLQVHGLMFAGVAIAAYGACKDVSVSIASALLELKTNKPTLTDKDLFRSGMVIGQDIIGTMVDTLIFAFLGSSIATVLLFISYGIDFNQLISSDFFAVEMTSALIGTAVVVIMVPVASWISGLLYTKF
ncbi:YibE/F family protein [Peptoniphilus equinus]|uniref:YibE/F family protein n=1 Tax=Peptoniphilus equinus TaxID=3016343 RepID=A0ABY7QSA6_9FIRM|nr:YibE/F family protein [Peptoniphilus equinus]WBW49667.1 YibE/F family protein [Peptoniphilus equinus]